MELYQRVEILVKIVMKNACFALDLATLNVLNAQLEITTIAQLSLVIVHVQTDTLRIQITVLNTFRKKKKKIKIKEKTKKIPFSMNFLKILNLLI